MKQFDISPIELTKDSMYDFERIRKWHTEILALSFGIDSDKINPSVFIFGAIRNIEEDDIVGVNDELGI